MSQIDNKIKWMASFLCLTFFAEQLAYAAPFSAMQTLPGSKELPIPSVSRSVALVDEVFRAPSSNNTFVIIQDPHTNESGQINITGVLQDLDAKNKIQTVFLEGMFGDDSFAFLRPLAAEAKRRKVAESMVKQGEMSGAELYDVATGTSMQFRGMEDEALYWKAVDAYGYVAKGRDHYQAYLKKVQSAVEAIKKKIYGVELTEFDQKNAGYLKGELTLTGYAEVLRSTGKRLGLNMTAYSNLQSIQAVEEKEKEIDFTKANYEQMEAVSALSIEEQAYLTDMVSGDNRKALRFSGSDQKAQHAYYAYLKEKVKDLSKYPSLKKYFGYLDAVEAMDPKQTLDEIKSLEAQIYEELLKSDDEKELYQAQKTVRRLSALFDLTLLSEEYKDYQKQIERYRIERATGFLNRQIMDLGMLYERFSFLEEGFDELVRQAEEFYNLTYQRDERFVRIAVDKMDASGQKAAVMVVGGYHLDNLKQLFKKEGISYVVVTPQVLKQTNQRRYEKKLLNQNQENAALLRAGIASATVAVVDHSFQTARTFAGRVTGDQAPAGSMDELRSWVGAQTGIATASVQPAASASGSRVAPSAQPVLGGGLGVYSGPTNYGTTLFTPSSLVRETAEVKYAGIKQLAEEMREFYRWLKPAASVSRIDGNNAQRSTPAAAAVYDKTAIAVRELAQALMRSENPTALSALITLAINAWREDGLDNPKKSDELWTNRFNRILRQSSLAALGANSGREIEISLQRFLASQNGPMDLLKLDLSQSEISNIAAVLNVNIQDDNYQVYAVRSRGQTRPSDLVFVSTASNRVIDIILDSAQQRPQANELLAAVKLARAAGSQGGLAGIVQIDQRLMTAPKTEVVDPAALNGIKVFLGADAKSIFILRADNAASQSASVVSAQPALVSSGAQDERARIRDLLIKMTEARAAGKVDELALYEALLGKILGGPVSGSRTSVQELLQNRIRAIIPWLNQNITTLRAARVLSDSTKVDRSLAEVMTALMDLQGSVSKGIGYESAEQADSSYRRANELLLIELPQQLKDLYREKAIPKNLETLLSDLSNRIQFLSDWVSLFASGISESQQLAALDLSSSAGTYSASGYALVNIPTSGVNLAGYLASLLGNPREITPRGDRGFDVKELRGLGRGGSETTQGIVFIPKNGFGTAYLMPFVDQKEFTPAQLKAIQGAITTNAQYRSVVEGASNRLEGVQVLMPGSQFHLTHNPFYKTATIWSSNLSVATSPALSAAQTAGTPIAGISRASSERTTDVRPIQRGPINDGLAFQGEEFSVEEPPILRSPSEVVIEEMSNLVSKGVEAIPSQGEVEAELFVRDAVRQLIDVERSLPKTGATDPTLGRLSVPLMEDVQAARWQFLNLIQEALSRGISLESLQSLTVLINWFHENQIPALFSPRGEGAGFTVDLDFSQKRWTYSLSNNADKNTARQASHQRGLQSVAGAESTVELRPTSIRLTFGDIRGNLLNSELNKSPFFKILQIYSGSPAQAGMAPDKLAAGSRVSVTRREALTAIAGLAVTGMSAAQQDSPLASDFITDADPNRNWFAAYAEVDFRLSGVTKLRLTFPTTQEGMLFRVRVLPKGVDKTRELGVSREVYKIPSSGVVEVDVLDFNRVDVKTQEFAIVSVHSGRGDWRDRDRFRPRTFDNNQAVPLKIELVRGSRVAETRELLQRAQADQVPVWIGYSMEGNQVAVSGVVESVNERTVVVISDADSSSIRIDLDSISSAVAEVEPELAVAGARAVPSGVFSRILISTMLAAGFLGYGNTFAGAESIGNTAPIAAVVVDQNLTGNIRLDQLSPDARSMINKMAAELAEMASSRNPSIYELFASGKWQEVFRVVPMMDSDAHGGAGVGGYDIIALDAGTVQWILQSNAAGETFAFEIAKRTLLHEAYHYINARSGEMASRTPDEEEAATRVQSLNFFGDNIYYASIGGQNIPFSLHIATDRNNEPVLADGKMAIFVNAYQDQIPQTDINRASLMEIKAWIQKNGPITPELNQRLNAEMQRLEALLGTMPSGARMTEFAQGEMPAAVKPLAVQVSELRQTIAALEKRIQDLEGTERRDMIPALRLRLSTLNNQLAELTLRADTPAEGGGRADLGAIEFTPVSMAGIGGVINRPTPKPTSAGTLVKNEQGLSAQRMMRYDAEQLQVVQITIPSASGADIRFNVARAIDQALQDILAQAQSTYGDIMGRNASAGAGLIVNAMMADPRVQPNEARVAYGNIHSLSTKYELGQVGGRSGTRLSEASVRSLVVALSTENVLKADGQTRSFALMDGADIRVFDAARSGNAVSAAERALQGQTDTIEFAIEDISAERGSARPAAAVSDVVVGGQSAGDVVSELRSAMMNANMAFADFPLESVMAHTKSIDMSFLASISERDRVIAHLAQIAAQASLLRASNKNITFHLENVPAEWDSLAQSFLFENKERPGIREAFVKTGDERLTTGAVVRLIRNDNQESLRNPNRRANELVMLVDGFNGNNDFAAWTTAFRASDAAISVYGSSFTAEAGFDVSKAPEALSNLVSAYKSHAKTGDAVTVSNLHTMFKAERLNELQGLAIVLPTIRALLAAALQGAQMILKATGSAA